MFELDVCLEAGVRTGTVRAEGVAGATESRSGMAAGRDLLSIVVVIQPGQGLDTIKADDYLGICSQLQIIGLELSFDEKPG